MSDDIVVYPDWANAWLTLVVPEKASHTVEQCKLWTMSIINGINFNFEPVYLIPDVSIILFLEKPQKEFIAGATGVGVRTLLNYIIEA